MRIILNANENDSHMYESEFVIKFLSTCNLNDNFEWFKRRAVFRALVMQETAVS